MEVGFLRAKNPKELVRQMYEIPWGEYLRPSDTNVKLKVIAGKSRFHTGKVQKSLEKCLAQYINKDSDNEQRIIIDLHDDKAKLLLNSSGQDLSDRFYRLQGFGSTKFPLPCNIAAACVENVDIESTDIIVDPFCGSGPILIEAALKALKIAPGLVRTRNSGPPYAFAAWPNYDRPRFESVVQACAADVVQDKGSIDLPRFLGSDRDAGIIQSAEAFAKLAGIDNIVNFRNGSLQEVMSDIAQASSSKSNGWVVSNPPWGIRGKSATSDLRRLYSALGDSLRKLEGNWQVSLLSPTFKEARLNLNATGMKWQVKTDGGFVSRGIPLQIFTARI